MILDQEKITRIKKLLKSRPKGLTISDISQILKLNRNSVAKYLEILLITGQVEMRLYGNAKVYYLSQRVPISSMLKFATELILILDTEQKIIDVNDNFLSFFGLQKENLIGSDIRAENIPGLGKIPFDALSEEPGMVDEGNIEISVARNDKEYCLSLKIVPTVFDDGSKGSTLIFEDVTQSREYEQKLKINEARYRAIVEDQTEFICRYNKDFIITFVNEAICQYFGRSNEEILGSNFLSNIHERDREFVKNNILSLNRECPVLTLEERVIDREGRTRWQQWTNRAIFDQSQNIIEYQGVGRDITERKEAEENLLIMNMAIASSINGIGLADLDGRITYANTAFLKIFGVASLEEILHKPIESLGNPKNPGPGVKDVLRGLREKGLWKGEILVIRNDGTQVHTHHTANMIRDNKGAPIAMMSSFIDITEKMEAEREIQIKNTAIESAMNGIVIFDPNQKLIYANQEFLKIFGVLSLDDMLKHHMEKFSKIIQNISPPFFEITKALNIQGKFSGELKVKMPDEATRFFQVSATRVWDKKGEHLCSVGIFMDITDQKVIEKALKTTYEKLQDAIEFMPDPTFIINRDRKVIAWNRALERISGVKRNDVLGTNTYSHAFGFLQGKRPILVDIIDLPAHELAKSYPAVRRFGDSIFVETLIPGRPDEKGIYLWGKATPLFDSEGRTIGAIESFRDMSEWKKAKESMQPTRNATGITPDHVAFSSMGFSNGLIWLDSALDHLSEGVAILDSDARIMKINPSFLSLLHRDREEMHGKDILSVCNPDDKSQVMEVLDRTRENLKKSEIIRVRLGQATQPLDAEITSLKDEKGHHLGHVIVLVQTMPLQR
ncbi:MAG: sensory histidine kinase AtoS [Methanoregulaceae archaeon PtaU1.Bin222]|nr:MAG: sensory histidine kinase AtoS [Methanoregulaceae archaeon PtaU1.Bin222]